MGASIGRWLKPAVFFLALLVLWQIAVNAFGIPFFILPSPTEIIVKLYEMPGQLADHALVTLYETLLGFLLAVIVGVSLAALIVHSRFLAESLFPLLVVTQVTPQVAVAPLLVIWFGSGDLPKIIIATLIAFFPIVINTATGLLRVDEELIQLVRGLNMSRWKIFLLIRVPNALPYVFAGMRISIAFAVIGAVVGEFVAANRGLGYVVFAGMANLDTRLTFASIAILAAMGIGLFWLVGVARRLALPWASEPSEGNV